MIRKYEIEYVRGSASNPWGVYRLLSYDSAYGEIHECPILIGSFETYSLAKAWVHKTENKDFLTRS